MLMATADTYNILIVHTETIHPTFPGMVPVYAYSPGISSNNFTFY